MRIIIILKQKTNLANTVVGSCSSSAISQLALLYLEDNLYLEYFTKVEIFSPFKSVYLSEILEQEQLMRVYIREKRRMSISRGAYRSMVRVW